MPRLVSLTLLSVLVLPAGALVYTLAIVIGFETYGWGAEVPVWLTANLLTFAIVIGWWLALWGRAVAWTRQRIQTTLLATGGSAFLGLVCGALTRLADIDETFALFVGGVSAMVAWLVAACVLWRDRTVTAAAGTAGSLASPGVVVCVKCGYTLNGLREARCPECGEVYTLDALLLAQPVFKSLGDLDRSAK